MHINFVVNENGTKRSLVDYVRWNKERKEGIDHKAWVYRCKGVWNYF